MDISWYMVTKFFDRIQRSSIFRFPKVFIFILFNTTLHGRKKSFAHSQFSRHKKTIIIWDKIESITKILA